MDIAGRHITDYLIKLLQVKGYAFNSTADFELVREIKEKYCFVSCDIESDRKLDAETTYYNSIHKLPDGRKIRISNEKYLLEHMMLHIFLAFLLFYHCSFLLKKFFRFINKYIFFFNLFKKKFKKGFYKRNIKLITFINIKK